MALLNEFKAAEMLIEKGASLNYCNQVGKTTLAICVEKSDKKAVKWIMKMKDLDIHVEDLNGLDPCDKAIDNEFNKKFIGLSKCEKAKRIKGKIVHSCHLSPKIVEKTQKLLNSDIFLGNDDELTQPMVDQPEDGNKEENLNNVANAKRKNK